MIKNAREILAEGNQSVIECRWDNLIDDFERAVVLCESPIEEIMLAALMNDHELLNCCTFVKICTLEEALQHRGDDTCIVPQANVGRYRVDFAVVQYREKCGLLKIAVECDGHDFHDRTKEQAQRDKSRDRFLMAAGWPVLRFTGSEIYKNSEECAYDVSGVLFEKHNERLQAVWNGSHS